MTLKRPYIDLEELDFKKSKKSNNKLILNHNDYIMSLACLTALRSPDPNTKVGAVIINQDRRIVGLGYNDFPKRYDGIFSKENELPLDREHKTEDNKLNTKYFYICHAAKNAILNKNSTNLKDCSLFSTLMPCNECMKLIIQCGIKTVYYLNDAKESWSNEQKDQIKGSKIMAKLCKIQLFQYEMKNIGPFKFLGEFDEMKKIEQENELININNSTPSNNILEDKDYYMYTALLTSFRSKDPKTQVGACIVNNNSIIISTGYNGFPNKYNDKFPWENDDNKINSKHMYVCHAELNAIVNKYDINVSNCILYCTLYPCYNCAQLIIQSQIKEVFYYEFGDDKKEKDEFKATKVLFDKYKIKCEPYKPNMQSFDPLIALK